MAENKCDFPYPISVPGLKCIRQGKAHDLYMIDGRPDLILMYTSDRISTHEQVHNSSVPNKGYALNAINVFFLLMLEKLGIKTHLVAHGKVIYDLLPKGIVYPADLHLRAIIVNKLDIIMIEFILRDYLAGSLWKKFYSKGLPNPYGIELPSGLNLMSKFAGTIFTPTIKSATDDPINTEETIANHREAYDLAYEVYTICRDFAATKGILVIDGKLEVGIDPATGKVVLGDECSTPDSFRFVPGDEVIIEGQNPTWKDKQPIREEAERLWGDGPKYPLTFSPEVIAKTSQIYTDLVKTLTGSELETL